MQVRGAINHADVNVNKHNKRGIRVLGIESSCDDTGVAIIDQNGSILSNCLHSQLKQHLNHGGIIPVVAKEYHLDNIDRVAKQAFRESQLQSVADDIDAIAVTTRPGLHFSLEVGLNYAKTLASKYHKPLIPIHHMQAHALMPLLEHRHQIRFPFLALLISGGHCLLAIAKRFNEFHMLGKTIDEAPGDLLDKFARRFKLRNLGSPFDSISGGAAIELLSRRPTADRFKYFNTEGSIPFLHTRNCDFSFTGFRNVLDNMAPTIDGLWSAGNREVLLDELGHLSASLQRGMLIQMAKKLSRAVLYYKMFWRRENEDAFAKDSEDEHLGFKLLERTDDDSQPIDLVVSGGVSANNYFIEGLKLACREGFGETGMNIYCPSKRLCCDNGLMIAWNGLLRYKAFLEGNKEVIKCDSIDESVICDASKFDAVNVNAQYPIGRDLGMLVKSANFNVERLDHSEFRTPRVG